MDALDNKSKAETWTVPKADWRRPWTLLSREHWVVITTIWVILCLTFGMSYVLIFARIIDEPKKKIENNTQMLEEMSARVDRLTELLLIQKQKEAEEDKTQVMKEKAAIIKEAVEILEKRNKEKGK